MAECLTSERVLLASARLVREVPFEAPRGFVVPAAFRVPRDVFTFMQPFAEREFTEVMWVLPLDSQHKLIDNTPLPVTRGLLNCSLVHPREVFRLAIAANAAAIVICHNHPSGDPTPSADDRLITEQLVAAGRLLDIPMHDHLVIGAGRYVSFAEAGLL